MDPPYYSVGPLYYSDPLHYMVIPPNEMRPFIIWWRSFIKLAPSSPFCLDISFAIMETLHIMMLFIYGRPTNPCEGFNMDVAPLDTYITLGLNISL